MKIELLKKEEWMNEDSLNGTKDPFKTPLLFVRFKKKQKRFSNSIVTNYFSQVIRMNY
jgi:hypothetical protein